MRPIPFLVIILLLTLAGCTAPDIPAEMDAALEDIKATFVPDETVDLLQWEVVRTEGGWEIQGETTCSEVIREVEQFIQEKGWERKVMSRMHLLPVPGSLDYPAAIATHSVVNLRKQPRHSSELVSQALLGTPMKVLKEEGYWLLIQTPDHYLSWVDRGSVALMEYQALQRYFSGPMVLITVPSSRLLDPEDQEVITDLVLGNILKLIDEAPYHFMVQLPSGTRSIIGKTEVSILQNWTDLEASRASLVRDAGYFMGMPYLWGGTSIKALDCSGFTKNVYFLNGLNLPRDANQQMQVGMLVDHVGDFSVLQGGDLLFFGRKATDSTAEYASHVGMWIGNGRFIHSSGNVHISSFDRESKYFDEYNLNRYLKTKRILDAPCEDSLSIASVYRHFIEGMGPVE